MYQIFEGIYKDGYPYGLGRCIQDDGQVIEGYWVDSDHPAKGEYYFINGMFFKSIDENSFFKY